MTNHFNASGEGRPYLTHSAQATTTSTKLWCLVDISTKFAKVSYHPAFLHRHLVVSDTNDHMSVRGADFFSYHILTMSALIS